MEIQFLKLKYVKIYVKSVKNSKIQPLQLSDTTAHTIRCFNSETKAIDGRPEGSLQPAGAARPPAQSWAFLANTHLGLINPLPCPANTKFKKD